MTPLISVDELTRLDAPVILSASMGPNPPTDGIPGAFLADLEADFSEPGHPLPHTVPADPARVFESYGISDDTTVVVYDDQLGVAAPRVWWLALVAGLTDVRVLDGSWTGERAPLSRPTRHGTITAAPRPGLLVDAATVAAGPRLLVDARSAGRFAGTESEPRPGLRSGRAPGSVNLPYTDVYRADGRMKSSAELQELFREVVGDRRDLVFSCGSGVTACVDALAATVAGYDDLAVYEGSWSEWGRPDSGRAVVQG